MERLTPAEGARTLVEGVLRAYASLLFLDRAAAGAFIAALTWLDPITAAGGLLGAVLATTAAMAFGFSTALIRGGLYGVAPLLTGMAITGFRGLAPTTLALAGAAALLALLVATLLTDHLHRRYGLNSMSLAFAGVATLILYHAPLPWMGPFATAPIRAFAPLDAFLSSLGAIIFLPIPEAGAILFVLLLVSSRSLAVLAVGGFATGVVLFRLMGGHDGAITVGMAGFNFMLTAMAVGGVYLVPGPLATLHAVGAVAVTAVLALAAERLLSPSGLPVFAWPFNLATLSWMAVLSLRGPGAAPRLARPLGGIPEAIASQRALLDRLPATVGASTFVPRLPILGEWTITQGVDGEPTHRPPWQHAWDFEVLDEDGFPFRVAGPGVGRDGGGGLLADYHCFGAPVVAVADGTVHHAVDGVHDNPPGQTNMTANYGNTIVIQHGPSLFSVYAHLKHGSVRVRPGETVPAGFVIAQCGASGRSPRPHLHFHVQSGPEIGTPTLPVAFSAYRVRTTSGRSANFRDVDTPRVHERVQAIATVPGALPTPSLTAGLRWTWNVTRGNRRQPETWVTDHDLWGGIRITVLGEGKQGAHPCSAVWSVGPRGRTATFWSGPRRSALHAFLLATSRIPAHVVPGLTWTDHPGADLVEPAWRRIATGLLLPVTGPRVGRMEFSSELDKGQMAITVRTGRVTIVSFWDEHSQPASFEARRGNRLELRAERIEKR